MPALHFAYIGFKGIFRWLTAGFDSYVKGQLALMLIVDFSIVAALGGLSLFFYRKARKG
ncbi:hypothetical protein SAMN05421823_102225 [Catalinimonas alkaloidigena]|uniref:Uncharacterized protein n=2 Tax=Catalinimonas alkaloidigena TaxID=1075417 RepID=A0A1G9AC68_9BACT|nr:hypothetical protein SAMN05421823_102225 [Catalinimonas alkaloidigena]